MPTQPVKTVRA